MAATGSSAAASRVSGALLLFCCRCGFAKGVLLPLPSLLVLLSAVQGQRVERACRCGVVVNAGAGAGRHTAFGVCTCGRRCRVWALRRGSNAAGDIFACDAACGVVGALGTWWCYFCRHEWRHFVRYVMCEMCEMRDRRKHVKSCDLTKLTAEMCVSKRHRCRFARFWGGWPGGTEWLCRRGM